jgi:hypothetical protein
MVGLGAYARVLLQFYLIYLAIFKRVKITGWYFILYALANMVGIQRVLSLSNNPAYTRIHGFLSVFEMPHYHEFVASYLINLFAGIYILTLK